MSEQKHIINRQVFELTIPERSRATHIQNLTAGIVRHKLMRELDHLFSAMSGKDEIIRIDKLEIDLGVLTETELENELVNRIIKDVETKINKHMISESKTIQNGVVKSKNAKDEFSVSSKSRNFLEQLVYFLQTGHLPWWHTSAGTDLTGYIFKEALNIENLVFSNAIIPLLRKPEIRQRLIFQLNHSQHHAFLKKLNEKLLESYTVQFQNLYSFFDSGTDKKNLVESFYSVSLLYFSMELELSSDDLKTGFLQQILNSVLSKLQVKEKDIFMLNILNSEQFRQPKFIQKDNIIVLSAALQNAFDLSVYSDGLVYAVQNLSLKNEPVLIQIKEQYLAKAQKDILSDSVNKIENEILSDEKEFSVAGKENENVTGQKNFSSFRPDSTTGDEQIVVFNAGLVLVHPFLRYFFEGLNLLDNKLNFKSMEDAFKAVHLLQFIVTGQELSGEIELPLNKILCGIDVSEPIPKNVHLTDEEKDECVFLIKTILERWDALKTTNPAALRDTYLQREGILKKSGPSWTLIVQRNTFDIMLEKLPWSISMVKLPWCQQILNVEW